MRTLVRSGLEGVACAALGLTAVGAQANAEAPDEVSASSVTEYWTEERMRGAIELDNLKISDRDELRAVPSGAPTEVEPTATETRAAGAPSLPGMGNSGAPWEGGGAIEKTAGRVFFKFDGKDASCSGDAVTSENGSTVITAGHCVKLEGKWHTDWMFVPAYNNGEAPYGEWPASKTLATPQWEADEDINYDVGAAVVRQVGGQRLTDVVGGQGLAFNQERGAEMYAFGYPAAPPYDGEKFIYCNGQTYDDPLGPITGSTAQGMPCDMTGGSSGGPWLREFDEATGLGKQNSLNSFGYVFLPGVMFGPYFGDDARDLYEKAQAS